MGMAPAELLSFDAALERVLQAAATLQPPAVERLPLLAALGRVLAAPITADRDQPPFDRCTRDGFAVRATDAVAGAALRVTGSLRAGQAWSGQPLQPGCAIGIMTGAPVPPGADAVVMVEHVQRHGETLHLAADRTWHRGENIVPQGSEAAAGAQLLAVGSELAAPEIALAAACGLQHLSVYRRPRVAILATGDELVEPGTASSLLPAQIWNSNSFGIAALVMEAGGDAVRLPIARDTRDELRATLAQCREADLIVLSGGVSMGEFDLVEEVLAEHQAQFFFTGVRMQPGKPVVFGRLGGLSDRPGPYFFGLPGNPISTQVTFRCFAAPLLRALAGGVVAGPCFAQATLEEEVAARPGLTRVLPARLTSRYDGSTVRLVAWQGSGDQAAHARSNCYAVLPAARESLCAGERISVLLR
ncbi:MAG: molybdopterin molybdotransferase MoeA [Acidobacteriota bacterium]|nr:molybdopterin molybdotransferase MoeA [Acidobacteriota bacterium]